MKLYMFLSLLVIEDSHETMVIEVNNLQCIRIVEDSQSILIHLVHKDKRLEFIIDTKDEFYEIKKEIINRLADISRFSNTGGLNK